jgi:hypothetical protein
MAHWAKFQPIPDNHVVGPKSAGGKGSRQEFLPSRHALSKLTKGSPADRTWGAYAKATPSGAGAPSTYDDIMKMGQTGIDLKRG